jgi:hypothetical protein
MKNLVKKFAIVLVCIIAFGVKSFAQTTAEKVDVKNDKKEFKSSLSADQKAALKTNNESRKAMHKEFAATLTPDQKAIMAEKSLSKEDRMEKLDKTLSPAQKEMRENNKKEMKENRKTFKKTLTPEQKKSLKEIHHENARAVGHKHHMSK